MPNIEIDRVIYDLGQQTPGMFPDPKRPPFTADDMRKAVENFDAGYFKPPVHKGHPKTDATDMALGSVRGVSFEDGKFIAKLSVQDSVKEDFDEERLLAHSPEFYRDFEGKGCALRGLGLLGATPPRQKNLPSLFSESDKHGDYDIISFSEAEEIGEPPMSTDTPPVVTPPAAAPTKEGKVYTDDEIKALTEAAVHNALEEANKTDEFAELQTEKENLEKANAKLMKDLDAQKAKERTAEHEAFAEGLEHLTADQRADVVALLNITEPADKKDHDIEVFAEDGTSETATPREILTRLTTPKAEAIKDTLRKTKAGAEKPTGTAAGEITIENFSEQEATQDNYLKVIELYAEKNDCTKSEAIEWIAVEHNDWFQKVDETLAE